MHDTDSQKQPPRNTIKELEAQIAEAESKALQLEIEPAYRDALTDRMIAYGKDFLAQLPDARGYDGTDRSHPMSNIEIPRQPRNFADVLDEIQNYVDMPGINPASGAHLGYIPGGGIFPSAIGDYLAAVTNRYAGVYYANPGAVRMENNLIRWIARLIGYPESAPGNMTSGGSIANLIGITAARDAKGVNSANVRKAVVYLTSQTHHCVHKALRIAGLAECPVRIVPLDERFRMRAEVLADLVERDIDQGLLPFLVIGSIGSTDTGAVDPIEAIADIAEEHGLWLQADAAYGGAFVLVDELKHLFKGVERSNSFIIDPHKGLFLPYGLGVVVVNDLDALYKSHHYAANYMQDALDDEVEISPADLSPELTKHFRGMRMWLPLQLFGTDTFAAALREKWLLARYFNQRIAQEGFETGPEPTLSVAIYRYSSPGIDDNAFNAQLIKLVQDDGRIFVSSTVVDGVFWLRAAVLVFRTHKRHVDLLIEILCEKRDALLRSGVATTDSSARPDF